MVFAKISDPQIMSNWAVAGAKGVTMADVEESLEHPNPTIQRAAAYQLARLGNALGVHLIQPDLYANDVETRQRARGVLLRACPQ